MCNFRLLTRDALLFPVRLWKDSTNTPFVDRVALAQASVTANTFIHLIPIGRAEIDLKLKKGTDSLLKLFGKKRLEHFFDLSRKSLY